MLDGQLLYQPQSGVLVLVQGGEVLDALSGAVIAGATEADYQKVKINNKLRKQLVERGASKQELKQLNDFKIQIMRQFNTALDQVKPK